MLYMSTSTIKSTVDLPVVPRWAGSGSFFLGVGNFYRGFIALFRRRRQQQQQQQPSKQKHHHQTKHTKRLLHCMDVATKRISIPFLSFCEVLWLGSFPTKLILASWTAFDTCQCGCANLIELLICGWCNWCIRFCRRRELLCQELFTGPSPRGSRRRRVESRDIHRYPIIL